MSVSSTVFGYHVQYLYTLYRMIESADSKEVFVPEGREDLDIYLNDQIIRVSSSVFQFLVSKTM